MSKAKSRLQRPEESNLQPSSATESPPRRPRATPALLTRYLKHLPTLSLSLPFLGVTGYIVTRVSPTQVRHFILPNTYLPLLAPFFLGMFFFLAFIFLNSRRAFFLSLSLTFFLFLKLHAVSLTWVIVAVPLTILLGSEVFAFFFKSRST